MTKANDIIKSKDRILKNATTETDNFKSIATQSIFGNESLNNLTKLQETFKLNIPNFSSLTKIGIDFNDISKSGIDFQSLKLNIPVINCNSLFTKLPTNIFVPTTDISFTKVGTDLLRINAFEQLQSTMSSITSSINSVLKPFELLNSTFEPIFEDCINNLNIDDDNNEAYISDELSEQIIDLISETASKTDLTNITSSIEHKRITFEQAIMFLSLLLGIVQFLYQINSDNSDTPSTVIIQINNGISDEEYLKLIESINDLNIKLDELSLK